MVGEGNGSLRPHAMVEGARFPAIMIATDYDKILAALATASRVLDANQGQLAAADIRIRCLVNIATKEAKRAFWEAGGAPAGPATGPLEAGGVALADLTAPSA